LTKLEELSTAWKSAYDAARVSQADYDAADADCMNALKAYISELDKQEENE
jgi:hypothetical protein